MGLFRRKKKIYVSSVVYNMAGNYTERTNYLKHILFNTIIAKNGLSISESIIRGTFDGPKLNYRAFFRWCMKNYPEGIPLGGIFASTPIPPLIVQSHITVPTGLTASVDLAEIDKADYGYWAEQYMNNYHYDIFDTDWSAEIDTDTNEITIIFEDESTESFMPANYDKEADYVYARYYETDPPSSGSPVLVETGEVEGPFDDEEDVPSTDAFYLDDEETIPSQEIDAYEIETVNITYSDSRPSEQNIFSSVLDTRVYTQELQTFERYTGIRADEDNPDRGWQTFEHRLVWQAPAKDRTEVSRTSVVDEIEPGVFRTTETIIEEESFLISGSQFWSQLLKYEIDLGIRSKPKSFIYKIGSGITELDDLQETVTAIDGYFPVIPVRTHNKMINEEPYLSTIYDIANKTWKRTSGGKKIDDLIDSVADNDNLSDIDHAFVTYGVPLNTLSKEGKEYIFEFFNTLYEIQQVNASAFIAFIESALTYAQYLDDLEEWQNDQSSGGQTSSPPPRPPAPVTVDPAMNVIHLKGQIPELKHYNMYLKWAGIVKTTNTGVWKPDAKKNEYGIIKAPDLLIPRGYTGKYGEIPNRETVSYSRFFIYNQITVNSYETLEVLGAIHQNNVYGNKVIEISSGEALNDNDDSGFIIPLHYSTLKKMNIVRANQLCLESAHIIFNCYVVKKQRWYETFIGKLLISALIMTVGAVLTGGASIIAGGGLLGANTAVGAMFGLTGLNAAIAGAAVNLIAASVLTHIVHEFAMELGEFGVIIAAIIGIVIGGISTTAGFSFDVTVFMKPENLLKLTDSLASAYSIHMEQKAQDTYNQIIDLESSYKKQLREIEGLMMELGGYSVNFDPMNLTDAAYINTESRDMFLSRTLLNGCDIVELSHLLISDFVEHTLNLENIRG